MRKIIRNSVIFLSIGAIIIIFVVVIMHSIAINDSFSSPFDKFNQKDYQNFEEIGNQLFLLYDEGYLTVGEKVVTTDYAIKSPKVENILSKYKNGIVAVHLVDKDVILISFGAIFQSVDGIAIRRNNAEFKKTYKGTGLDNGTLNYFELIPNVFHFTAGV